jgi:hypothetical protein
MAPDEIDRAQWHGLRRTLTGVKSLQLTGVLAGGLFRSLRLDDVVLTLELHVVQ